MTASIVGEQKQKFLTDYPELDDADPSGTIEQHRAMTAWYAKKSGREMSEFKRLDGSYYADAEPRYQ